MSTYGDKIEHLLADDTFVAWIEGHASQDVSDHWEAWLADDPVRKQLVEQARMLHEGVRFRYEIRPEMEAELKKLREAIGQEHNEQSKKPSKNSNFFLKRKRSTYSRVAAVMLLFVTAISAFTVYSFYEPTVQQPEKQQQVVEFNNTSTQNGQKKVLTLSDGSTITLNANSSLRYPMQYSGGDLEVWLEGEAFFDIVHKTGTETRSFSVNVPNGKVEVLGTQFNVNTYEEATEVVLLEGKVSVEMTDTLRRVADTYVMHAGEMSRISSSMQAIQTAPVQADLYTAWTQDKLIFKDTPLVKVAQRIAHIYGVEFQLNDAEMKNIMVSGSLPNNNLDVFLNALQNMLNRPVANRNGTIALGKKK